jgi:starch synthase (maltosyl-transferring)
MPTNRPARIVIQYPQPTVDGGRYPVKSCIGDTIAVSADIFRDGHDRLLTVARYRLADKSRAADNETTADPATHIREVPLRPIDAARDGVRWAGEFVVDAVGDWEYEIEAWVDTFGTWREELRRKLDAGQADLSGEISEGRLLLERAASLAFEADDDPAVAAITRAVADLDTDPAQAIGDIVYEAVRRHEARSGLASSGVLPLRVDRTRARFSAWYELFPRSWGGFKGVQEQLPRLAELGFDIVYLPPIHPIGHTNRKGRDNSLTAAPGDPGSPWAIGDETGGHDAIHPELGTLEEFKALVQTGRRYDIDIAIDLAIQCSADHPWLTEHPEWFHRRPDGTLKYAENPPKKYQDIYNVNWDCEDWQGLWMALLNVTVHWVDAGVKVFRVDNPHTKPAAFWGWLIDQVHRIDPDVIFLAEAFTKRAVMRHLGKTGFTQGYTYFTWKNSRWDLTEYVTELAYTEEQLYFRPNFFANTPDILHAYLQEGGRPAFEARLVLAATLSPSYGIYSGFENCENLPAKPGSEEYLHSEKYEIRDRRLDGELLPLIARINHARHENAALQYFDNVTFLETENDALIAYAKQSDSNTLVTVVNIDPHNVQEGLAVIPAQLGLPPVFGVRDLLSDVQFDWRLGRNYVRLDPGRSHILAVRH